MSTLAQLRHERIAKLEYDNDYLRGQVDCLVGNPANVGNIAYQAGYSVATAWLEKQTALAEALELPDGCF
ncbi:MAG: hypothetical protein ACXW0Q_07410 [Methylovulum sp.]